MKLVITKMPCEGFLIKEGEERIYKDANFTKLHIDVFREQGSHVGYIFADTNPFGNCQVFSIGYMNILVRAVSDIGDRENPSQQMLDEFRKAIFEIRKMAKTEKRILYCEVRKTYGYELFLEKAFKVKGRVEYQNLTGSTMVALYLQIEQ